MFASRFLSVTCRKRCTPEWQTRPCELEKLFWGSCETLENKTKRRWARNVSKKHRTGLADLLGLGLLSLRDPFSFPQKALDFSSGGWSSRRDVSAIVTWLGFTVSLQSQRGRVQIWRVWKRDSRERKKRGKLLAGWSKWPHLGDEVDERIEHGGIDRFINQVPGASNVKQWPTCFPGIRPKSTMTGAETLLDRCRAHVAQDACCFLKYQAVGLVSPCGVCVFEAWVT